MGKTVLIGTLWGLAAWMWVAIAHTFMGTPDLSPIAAILTGAAIVARSIVTRPSVQQRASATA